MPCAHACFLIRIQRTEQLYCLAHQAIGILRDIAH